MTKQSATNNSSEKVNLLMDGVIRLMGEHNVGGGAVFLIESEFGIISFGRDFDVLSKEAVALSVMATLTKLYGLDFLDELSLNMGDIKGLIKSSLDKQNLDSGVLH